MLVVWDLLFNEYQVYNVSRTVRSNHYFYYGLMLSKFILMETGVHGSEKHLHRLNVKFVVSKAYEMDKWPEITIAYCVFKEPLRGGNLCFNITWSLSLFLVDISVLHEVTIS